MGEKPREQVVGFFLKRADYAATLAAQHCRDTEFDKGAKLFKEAYVFYKKAEQALPDDAEIKQKVEETKLSYQDAMKKMKEKE